MEPTLIDINDWKMTGGGAQGDSYIDKATGNYLLKMFHANQARYSIEDEVTRSLNVYEAGIPSPEPGRFVTDGEHFGAIFKLIKNKNSFCTAISKNPDCLEDIATRFAKMTRDLHSAKVNRDKFEPATVLYRNLLNINTTMDADMKAACDRILTGMEGSKAEPSYVHGDLHFGNVITDGVKDYFIDLGQFSYGDPLIDDSMNYFICKLTQEHMIQYLYHVDHATGLKFWDVFEKNYFDKPLASDDAYMDLYAPYLLLRTLIFEREIGNDEYNKAYRKMFMDRIAK